jgi:serine/threonine-protein kinase
MIGKKIGNYELTEKIGEGGMGAVYKALDCVLQRDVAIKMLRPELTSQPQIVERFHIEAIALAKLNHPNIATVYNFVHDESDYFMVLEYVPGDTLARTIKANGAMLVEQTLLLFMQALDAVSHAHEMGVIHRDIKPANILLTDTGVLKLTDFGIARVIGTSRITRKGGVVGTVEYISPEQILGEEGDERSDIYSLGILLYEMLLGRVPFQSDSEFELMKSQVEKLPPPPRSMASHIPLEVEEAIMRSLAKKPEARFQTATEFRTALENVLRPALLSSDDLLLPVGKIKLVYAAPETRPDDSLAAYGVEATGTAELGSIQSETEEVPTPSAYELANSGTKLDGSLLSSPDQTSETISAEDLASSPLPSASQSNESSPLDGGTNQNGGADQPDAPDASAEQWAGENAQPQRSADVKRAWPYYLIALLLLLALVAFTTMRAGDDRGNAQGDGDLQSLASRPAAPSPEQTARNLHKAEAGVASDIKGNAQKPGSATSDNLKDQVGNETSLEKSGPRRAQKKSGGMGGFFKKVITFGKSD